MLIYSSFHHICVSLSLGLIAFVDLWFVEDVHPSLPDRCKHTGIEHEETMRKDHCLQILPLRRFFLSLTDETKGWWKNLCLILILLRWKNT